MTTPYATRMRVNIKYINRAADSVFDMYLIGNMEFSKRAKSALGLEISGNLS